jgi:lipid-A-disaccharide synthase
MVGRPQGQIHQETTHVSGHRDRRHLVPEHPVLNARILVLAGEASGDHHAALVVAALRRRFGGLSFIGLGGPDLADEGLESMAALDDLAVMGFVEVLRHARFFWRLERRIVARMDAGEVDLVLAIDYPGLNLRLVRKARERGIPVVYYIAPQVWAWKAHRAAHLARDADRVAVILPFEAEGLAAAGADVTFVGHPLMERAPIDLDEAGLRAELGLRPAEAAGEGPLMALLPGSRDQEIGRHLDLFAETARRLAAAHPGLRPVFAAASGVDPARLAATGLPVTSQTRALLTHSRIALVKSGTSTLEAALAGVPFACVYRTHPITFALAQRLVKVPHIALANLVAGRRVVPELLQSEATPANLEAELTALLGDGRVRQAQLDGLAEVKARLGGPGASDQVADLVVEVLRERGFETPSDSGPAEERA